MRPVYIIDSKSDLEKILNNYNSKDIYYVDNSYIFRFPISHLSLYNLTRFKGKKFKRRFLEVCNRINVFKTDEVLVRYKRGIRFLGNYKWFFSAIIGIVESKKVVVYHELSKSEIPYRVFRLNLLIDYAEENDNILIIPIEKGSDISEIKNYKRYIVNE